MLWEKSDEYLISSYQEDKIAGLIFSILFKAFNSNHSSFYYKIKRPSRNTVNLDNCPELEQTPDETTLDNTDQQIIWMRQAINQLQCYDRRIMEFYLELNCNLSATARKMQINTTYVSRAIKRSKEIMKAIIQKKIDEND